MIDWIIHQMRIQFVLVWADIQWLCNILFCCTMWQSKDLFGNRVTGDDLNARLILQLLKEWRVCNLDDCLYMMGNFLQYSGSICKIAGAGFCARGVLKDKLTFSIASQGWMKNNNMLIRVKSSSVLIGSKDGVVCWLPWCWQLWKSEESHLHCCILASSSLVN